jgi:hypothetical protein
MQELLRRSSQLTAIDSFSGFKVDFFSISAVHIVKINFSCQFNSLKYWFCQKTRFESDCVINADFVEKSFYE